MVDALHEGDLPKFMKFVAGDAKLLNARGREGSTPFMYAVLYTNAATLERLLKLGADPNKRNDANATALMWAATEMDKTRMLLSHGADVNARSSDMRTPLMIAARKPPSPCVPCNSMRPSWNMHLTTRPFNWPRRGSLNSSPKATKTASDVSRDSFGAASTRMPFRRLCTT
jgi:hypothetical protein